MNLYFRGWEKYAVFSGRATRSEYWIFLLGHFVAFLGLILMTAFEVALFQKDYAFSFFLLPLYWLAASIPMFAVAVRRLHDTNRTGWWVWINLIPLIGLIFIYFMCAKGDAGANQYGNLSVV